MQTVRQSAREAWVNTSSAFFLSMFAHYFIVAPVVDYYGLDYGGLLTAFFITLFYTALSLLRNFIVRRLFVRLDE